MAQGTARLVVSDEQFRAALRQYDRVYTNKTAPDIINQAAKDLGFAAARRTKMAPKRNISKHKPNPATFPGRLLYAIQNPNSNQPPSSPGLAPSLTGTRHENARFLYNRRIEGRRYIAVGWLGALVRFGAPVRTRVSQGLIRGSFARRATPESHQAMLGNGAYGSAEVGFKPLQEALKEVAAKKVERANARLEKLAKRFSGK